MATLFLLSLLACGLIMAVSMQVLQHQFERLDFVVLSAEIGYVPSPYRLPKKDP